jgi:hypothetical protein
MFEFEANEAVIVEQRNALERAMSTNPKTQKALQKLIRQIVMEARARVMTSFPLNDPRESKKSIRTTVYKKVLGANINIYNSRKAHGRTDYEPPRKLRAGQRGGNRRPRSVRTDTVMHYGPYDRGWILRFHNDGTAQRNIQKLTEIKRADGTSKFRWTSDNGRYGNRGSLRARHWFRGAGEEALVAAADKLANLIDDELENILNKKN